ncbi:MAG: 23S rRNA (adenine(2503)-C(2))-methyltransferase RlmN [Patescibacteria group bacterium]|jgi:23S rRNA (adenine2503-C2)-methyltransferase
MDFHKLQKTIAEIKLPAFREKQVRRAYYNELAGSWDEVTVLPKDLRHKLAKEIAWDSLSPAKAVKGGEDIVKALFNTDDERKIESVLIRHADGRNTVCVSSQVGCPLGCLFCATGQGGFKRNLLAHEIAEQVVYFARMLKNMDCGTRDKDGRALTEKAGGAENYESDKITNIVFMGMGEPMLNYDNVLAAVKIFNDKDGFNLGARRISISTIGITEGIRKFAKENLQVNLALSLHAPNDKLRDELCPVNKKYPVKKILSAVDDYIEKTNRRVMVEYIMLEKINDFPEQARELAELLKSRRLCYVNLIIYNKAITLDKKLKLAPSSRERVQAFKEILEKNNITVTIRKEFGGAIWAACGMLKSHNQ